MGSMNILWILCIKQLDERIDYLLEETHHLTSPIISHRLSPGSAKIHQASFGQTLSFQQINQLQTQWRWLQAYRNLDDFCSSKKISWIKPGHKKKTTDQKKVTTQFNTMAEGKKQKQPSPFLFPGKKKHTHTQLPPPIKPGPLPPKYLSQPQRFQVQEEKWRYQLTTPSTSNHLTIQQSTWQWQW